MALVEKSFEEIITFTRASEATYFGSDGLMKTAAVDEPRIDYDPITLEKKGLLMEERRENSVKYSEDLTKSVWNKEIYGSLATSKSKIAANAEARVHGFYQAFPTWTDTQRVVEVIASAAEYSFLHIAFGRISPQDGVSHSGTFDLTLGTVIKVGSWGASATIENIGGGKWKCVWVGGANTKTGEKLSISFSPTADTNNYLGDGTSGINIWGVQLETGAFPTSYIPTLDQPVTRQQDIAKVFDAPEWTCGPKVGTYVVEYELPDTNTNRYANYPRSISSDYSNGAIAAFNSDRRTVTYNGIMEVAVSTSVGSTLHKVATAFDNAGRAIAINGSYNSGTGLLQEVLNNISIMGAGDSNNSFVATGWIKSVDFYPYRFTQQEMIDITTPV